jgi:transcriptional antiterminator NusG
MIEANLVGEIPHIIKNIPGVISFLSLTKEEILFRCENLK